MCTEYKHINTSINKGGKKQRIWMHMHVCIASCSIVGKNIIKSFILLLRFEFTYRSHKEMLFKNASIRTRAAIIKLWYDRGGWVRCKEPYSKCWKCKNCQTDVKNSICSLPIHTRILSVHHLSIWKQYTHIVTAWLCSICVRLSRYHSIIDHEKGITVCAARLFTCNVQMQKCYGVSHEEIDFFM